MTLVRTDGAGKAKSRREKPLRPGNYYAEVTANVIPTVVECTSVTSQKVRVRR